MLSILSNSMPGSAQDVFAGDIVHPEIWENVVYEGNVLDDKSFGYFQMTISERYFNGTQSLAIRVIPEQFDSDPDIFISKNVTRPTNSLNSQWYCVKQGGDTCIINRNEIAIGDSLYIGVRCINPCQYTLSSNWVSTIRVNQNNRTQYRLEGFSSNIFEYLVPSTNTNGLTRAVYMQVEPERPYSPIDLYFSLDSSIYQVEERKIEQILTNGAGYAFTENDFGWCTGCFIYLLVDVTFEGRYYITFEPSPRDRTLSDRRSTDIMVSLRQQECGLYFTRSANNDVLIIATGYQGDTEFYISGSTRPSDNQDSRRILQISQRVPTKAIFISSEDRRRWGVSTGVMNVCVYGFDVSSVNLRVEEQNFGGRVDVQSGVIYTFNLERNNTRNFRFTQSTFVNPGTITVTMTNHNLTSNQSPARVFYTICTSGNPNECSLNETQVRGRGMIEIAPGNANVQGGNTRTATIVHNPRNCRVPSRCFYMISVFFPDQNGPMRTSFSVAYNVTEYHEIRLNQKYRNIIPQGAYFNYALVPNSTPGHEFMKGLTIKLESIIGDADLVVSVNIQNPEINQNQIEAGSSGRFDSITLNKTGNFSLNRHIYIAVYAQSFSVYELSFEATYELEYDAKLTMATPIRESIGYYNMYLQETEESFYSFKPWWAGYENRTMVFFADVTFNNVFFYMMPNDYPQFYQTEYQDKNDVIVLRPGDRGYSLDNTYYIRIRPDFQLQDLISRRQYIFTFFAFSQQQSHVIQDIHLNELKLGYANRTHMYYRHFIIENNATYNFSLIPIIGNPALLLKLSNEAVYPRSENVLSWDYKSDNPGKERDSIVVTFADRSGRYAFCERAGFNLNGGNRSCGFYLAVECQTECIYNITVQIVGRERQALPKYIIEEDYYTGQVGFNQTSYFYYPMSRFQTGEMVVVLNKTAPLRQNGDAMILGSIMPESASFRLENWSYPTLRNYTIASATYRPNQPEIIEICSQFINTRCSNSSCILMLGVLGLTPDATSNFRIIIHREKNLLRSESPIKGFISEVGKYDYYWFTSNVSVSNFNNQWEYTITSSVEQDGQDVDLFVSAIDGRFPTSDDFDFGSDHLGPDDIHISSQSQFFEDAGYNKSDGIVFVVGVKALTPNVSYTLMMTGPQKQQISITNLTTGVQQTRTLTNRAGNNVEYYKWFNWGHKDFRINLEVSSGSVAAYINFVGEEVFMTNGFQALPVNQNNSKWQVSLRQNEAGVLRVTKEEIGGTNLFCYFCWYYITVANNATGNSVYRIAVNEIPDVGEEVPFINLNTSQTFTLPATGTVTQRKFILDSKDPIEITASVTLGYLVMYVGLYPNSPLNRFQWRTEGSQRLRIYVRQTDQNLRVGSFYYITLQSGQGRTAFSLQLNQNREIKYLENGIVYKEQYWNQEEQIKLYYFQTPNWRGNYRAVINILSLTEDFYPTVLLFKNQRTAAVSNADRQLTYPNIRNFNLSFGDNFFAIANQRNFTYQFRDVGSNFTFFTMALYNFQYGMTDRRKPQFKIQVFFDNRTISQSHFAPSSYMSETAEMYELTDINEIVSSEEIARQEENAFFNENTFFLDDEDEPESLFERANDWIISTISDVEKQVHSARKFLHNHH